jgi:competence protein ComEC
MPNYQRVVVRFKIIPVISYGDMINVQGKLDYFTVENGDRIAYMSYPKFQIVEKGTDSNLILRFREKIIYFFDSNLPQSWAALMLGIVFGIKEEMPKSFYLDLQKTGLMHVIAASGMNITMLGGFLSSGLILFFRRQVALALTITGIIIYAVLAGLEPSIVRAAIMGILVFLAQLTGRQNSAFLALFLAGFIMLFRSPNLILDIGFQLSFLATFGLIYLRPLFTLIPRIKNALEKTVVGEDLVTTLTAQIMTLPILLANFGSYSLISIPVNAIILWTVPILMIIGGISVFVGIIIEPFGRLILYLSVPFLLYFTKIVEFFSTFGGQIELKSLPFIFICGYYLVIFSLILFIRNRK